MVRGKINIIKLIRTFNRKQKIVLALIILIIIAMITGVCMIINLIIDHAQPVSVMQNTEIHDEYGKNADKHDYNLDNIVDKNGYKYYYDSSGKKSSSLGIDVSYAQKKIDWDKVKSEGVDFAIIRLGYRGYETGILHTDEYFYDNVKGAVDAGVEVGVYFFSQAINIAEAREEAEYVLEKIKDMDITYPVVFDWEVISGNPARTDGISGDTLNKCAIEFCRKIEEAGYKPMIYASLNLLRDQYEKYDIDIISQYDLWLAEYKEYPEYPYDFKIWQYTNEGIIDGIDFKTDLNVYFNEVDTE